MQNVMLRLESWEGERLRGILHEGPVFEEVRERTFLRQSVWGLLWRQRSRCLRCGRVGDIMLSLIHI